jgi:hypothetical protein
MEDVMPVGAERVALTKAVGGDVRALEDEYFIASRSHRQHPSD